MNVSLWVTILPMIIAGAALAWQIISWNQTRRTRVLLRANPAAAEDRASWLMTATVINRSQNPVYIRRLRIAHSRYPTWFVDLRPLDGETQPLRVDAYSEAAYAVDGDEAVRALGELNECICVATTSDDKGFKLHLGSKNYRFETMCVVESLKVDDGSGHGASFPLPEDEMAEKVAARLIDWKLRFLVERGWCETWVDAKGDTRYRATEKGRETIRTGSFAPKHEELLRAFPEITGEGHGTRLRQLWRPWRMWRRPHPFG